MNERSNKCTPKQESRNSKLAWSPVPTSHQEAAGAYLPRAGPYRPWDTAERSLLC